MANPTLSDLDAGTSSSTTQDNPSLIKPGGTEPTPADLAAEQQRLADEAAKKPLVDQDPKKPAADDTKGDDDDAADDEPEGSVWEDVDALRGEKIEITWEDAQGAIPEAERDTPRGILARERFLESRAVVEFENTLSKKDPRGYQYLLHREAGGTDEEFFATKTITLPDYDLFKDSVDLQAKVYGESLRNAGLNEKSIKHEVDRAVKDKEILELADAAYKKQQKAETDGIAELNRQLEQDRVQFERGNAAVRKAISEQIVSKDMKFIVPDAKRPEFEQFVLRHTQYDQNTGQYLIVQPLDPKMLARQMEAMFLLFSGGDLSGIIQREAQTANTRRLRRSVERAKQTGSTQNDDRPGRKTLGEL